MSEFEQIRKALGLTLDEMAAAMGSTHATVHRWETSPNTRSGRQALEAAKTLYKKRSKEEWKQREALVVAGPTRDEVAELRGRIARLEDDVRALLPLALAVKDLDVRVQRVERKAGTGE